VLLIAVLLSTAGVFVLDLLLPRGIAALVLYFVPLAISLYGSRPALPLLIAGTATGCIVIAYVVSPIPADLPHYVPYANRGLGVIATWSFAVLARRIILSKNDIAKRDWVRTGQRDLGVCIQGEQGLAELVEKTLRFLCHYVGAPVGVAYTRASDRNLELTASHAARASESASTIAVGEGLIGQALTCQRLTCLESVPPDYLTVSSGLGRASPRHVVVLPAAVDADLFAVYEFAFLTRPQAHALELLETVAEALAIAVRTAQDRARLRELLEETQHQTEELQTQQEELRVSNEELEERNRALQETQARLEHQQEELEQTNVQLEEQAQVLERQRDELSRARSTLADRAEELARSNRYKSEFLANMSHELRTPLNSALILAKLLADNPDNNLTQEQVRYAATIYSSGNDLLTLINDILDLSRIEAGRLDVAHERVELSRLVETLRRTFEPVANDKNLGLEFHVEEGTPSAIPTDQLRLEQILRNLLSNALKFTDRGHARLGIHRTERGRIAFAVSDTGAGIPEDQQEVIFEAFRQADGSTHRRHGGTGLGLTISRELARRLGGTLSVVSKVGAGSTFTLELPASPEQHPPASEPKEAQRSERPREAETHPAVEDDRDMAERGDRAILVIEDDVPFAEILRDLARDQRFRAVVATSAREGLLLAREVAPSAILLDVHLPDGSGLGVLERLKSDPTTRHIPVHVISVADHAQRALELGAVGYDTKPVVRSQLLAALTRLEQRLSQKTRRVLVVEDAEVQRESIISLLSNESVEVDSVGTGEGALARLNESTYDCVVLDLALPDISGFDLLERMARGEAVSFPPVIVYTGRQLTREEETRLERMASSIIIKGARSPERLLNEVTLFLHQVVAKLPVDKQKLLREARSREAALEGKTILLAEDDVRNVFALTSVIEPWGAKLRVARNGLEALQALEQAHKEKDATVDLVLMDIMMPEMDGLTAMREIRKRPEWRRLPIIALTAKAMPDDREKCLEAGANDYVAKPFDVDRLLSLIKVWIPK
jgi:CheY-like chemotaxis protein